jgi:hypothetical protein
MSGGHTSVRERNLCATGKARLVIEQDLLVLVVHAGRVPPPSKAAVDSRLVRRPSECDGCTGRFAPRQVETSEICGFPAAGWHWAGTNCEPGSQESH